MDVYAESAATAGGEGVAPVLLDNPRVVEGQSDYSRLADQSRQAAFNHIQQTAQQQGNAVS